MLHEFYREVTECVRRGTEQIEYCSHLVERKIEEDKTTLLLGQEGGTVCNASIGRLWQHLELTLGNTFRYTLLSGVCAVVEECVNAIVDRVLPDEVARTKTLKKAVKEVKAKKGWANWLESRIEAISTVATLNLPAQFQSDLELFTDIITLRNCIGHAWGNVEKTDYPEQVRDAVRKLASEGSVQNTELASISSDGNLVLGRDMVPRALFLAVEIIDLLCGELSAHEAGKPSTSPGPA